MARLDLVAELSGRVLDLLLPPRCLACGAEIVRPGALCSACWDEVAFIAPPYCALCGYPFDFDSGPAALCAACLREPPAFERARAVMRYDARGRALVLGFKHGDRTEGVPSYASWLARAGAELLADAEILAPVPLHWRRQFARRYNQAALLAQALARDSGVPLVPDLLRRRRATPSQGRLSAAARARNVAGAFAVNPARAETLAGRRVLLIDDVLTTGATAGACAAALRRGGAAAVDVLVLARVAQPRG